MMTLKTKHFLTGAEISEKELAGLMDLAMTLKKETKCRSFRNILQGQHLALLFDKPSLRTRFSFTVGVHQLGGQVVESVGGSRKCETPHDCIRVLQGYVDGLMYRTFSHETLDKMAEISTIPIINGLSDTHHPCQALADLLTLKEEFGDVTGKTLTYIGDGNNVLHSLLVVLPKAGVNVRYLCPEGHNPSPEIVALAKSQNAKGTIKACESLTEACEGTNAIYTDVWTSMGQESQKNERTKAFDGLQVNESLLAMANSNAIVLHCMPMVRGEEISETLPEHAQSRIFVQCENRLHAQKALLVALMSPEQ